MKMYPAKGKANPITGRIPIYVRFTGGRIKAECRLPLDLTPEDSKLWNQTLERIDIKESDINKYLNTIEDKFMKFCLQNATNSKVYTPQEVRDEIMGVKTSKAISIYEYANQYYKQSIDQNPKFAISTKKNYRKALRHLLSFVEYSGLSKTSIQNLDYKFASAFSDFLMTEHPNLDRSAQSEVTACGNIKKFRKIFNEAVEEDLIPKNPFLKIKLSYVSPEKPKIGLEHVKSLFQNNLAKSEKVTADIFLFMCLVGCAFNDCMGLTVENLEVSKDGTKLKYNRNKSGVESSQYLSDHALKILAQFHNISSVRIEGRLVPRISNQQLNRTLKIISAKLYLPFGLTSHDARHTYRMLLDEADIVDPSVICKLMGWSNKDKMDSIYRKVTDSRLLKTKQNLDHLIETLID